MRFGSAVRHASLGSPHAWGSFLAKGRNLNLAPRSRGFCLLRLMGRLAWTLGELRLGGIGLSASPSQTRAQSRLTPAGPHVRGGGDKRLECYALVLTTAFCLPVPTRTAEDAGAEHPPSATQRLATTPAALPEQVRSVLRLLPNSIVVCTSAHGGAPRGMTMSSFTSLSLSPTPLVSFNVATPSRTLDAIREARLFNIHVMAGDARGAAMADRFTRGNLEDVFGGMQYTTPEIPLLRGDGVLYALRCRLLPDEPTGGLVRVRDHVIVVGEVLGVMAGAGTEEFGLAYADRKYRHVGGVIARGRRDIDES
ncbi:Uncharacterized protein ESCO_006427 [Escovopsis weberi]|uniref:Flavin reductase like domain-containing protein n=1 Tax=Escovopsis weberi TaxID=150374 RepID=A0A0N0RSY6_ESCWE|nr:Uncharacterized protein ESCO_006427 [Escovopsis weberi]